MSVSNTVYQQVPKSVSNEGTNKLPFSIGKLSAIGVPNFDTGRYPPLPGTILRIPGSTVVATKSGDFYEVSRGDLTGKEITNPPARIFFSIPEWLSFVGAPDDCEIFVQERM